MILHPAYGSIIVKPRIDNVAETELKVEVRHAYNRFSEVYVSILHLLIYMVLRNHTVADILLQVGLHVLFLLFFFVMLEKESTLRKL